MRSTKGQLHLLRGSVRTEGSIRHVDQVTMPHALGELAASNALIVLDEDAAADWARDAAPDLVDPLGRAAVRAGLLGNQLGLHPRGGERQRLRPRIDQPGKHAGRLTVWVAVALPDDEVECRAAGGVVVDRQHVVDPGQPGEVIGRCGDGARDRHGCDRDAESLLVHICLPSNAVPSMGSGSSGNIPATFPTTIPRAPNPISAPSACRGLGGIWRAYPPVYPRMRRCRRVGVYRFMP